MVSCRSACLPCGTPPLSAMKVAHTPPHPTPLHLHHPTPPPPVSHRHISMGSHTTLEGSLETLMHGRRGAFRAMPYATWGGGGGGGGRGEGAV